MHWHYRGAGARANNIESVGWIFSHLMFGVVVGTSGLTMPKDGRYLDVFCVRFV